MDIFKRREHMRALYYTFKDSRYRAASRVENAIKSDKLCLIKDIMRTYVY